ncbi:F-box protein At5g49610-like [Oryza brachyantha]|uniref:F-box domain-containing protein n=1 Tax=Oryza brachyantha TaxID=4533 RepID=J3MLL7_ORYBR|nr:F-box protein At5g49610-like [Oryza brachyantha]
MENLPMERNPADGLFDELIFEILRRLPIRSLCRCKCVCRSWRGLIAEHEHRKRLPQTLSGFFYRSMNRERCPVSAYHFTNVTGRGAPLIYPSFSFLPPCAGLTVLDCCNGLFLCRCDVSLETMRFNYAVCNPATKEWVMLPESSCDVFETRIASVCFDPAISSHFHVVGYVEDEDEYVRRLEIYSSKAGSWSLHESGWDDLVYLDPSIDRRSVFLNGFLHSVTSADIVAVDMEAKKWRRIPLPDVGGDTGVIHKSQGRLCAFIHLLETFKLSVWVLEDYGTDNWIFRHTISPLSLFGGMNYRLDVKYHVVAAHPDCNLIFFVYGSNNILMSYQMDSKKLRVIRMLGHDLYWPYLPYVPLFSELLTNGH